MDMIAWSCVFALALLAMVLDRARTIHKKARRRVEALNASLVLQRRALAREHGELLRERDRLDAYVHEPGDDTGTTDAAIALIEQRPPWRKAQAEVRRHVREQERIEASERLARILNVANRAKKYVFKADEVEIIELNLDEIEALIEKQATEITELEERLEQCTEGVAL